MMALFFNYTIEHYEILNNGDCMIETNDFICYNNNTRSYNLSLTT